MGLENKFKQQLRRRLYHWVEANPKRLVRVWGREKFKRTVLIRLEHEFGVPQFDQVVAFIGF
ncbi:hypothetical protein AGABI2DRAFT_190929 [Agaricus bisporus var. bisporus H97]|uniref:hypothetical protein n=1 Tax=Agaricus bisporus var. bisporus (strain H97 / ATCC MYA-4626 / FGSC 10389) TaxID=936046 RepID=UPI00029F7BB1|nr:hypothetical protein AGABI2DRAFT_190929 [Agaricus bisporus var. bisporus H97]EKV50682.1 hypothetical protein AGABI2DRAFT_190929 [Agaricus bisporus var. bisporus H97]